MSRPTHSFSRQQSFGHNFMRNNVPPEKANIQQTILRTCNQVSVEISNDTLSLWEETHHCTTLQLFVCMAWPSNTWGGEACDGLWRCAMAPCGHCWLVVVSLKLSGPLPMLDHCPTAPSHQQSNGTWCATATHNHLGTCDMDLNLSQLLR